MFYTLSENARRQLVAGIINPANDPSEVELRLVLRAYLDDIENVRAQLPGVVAELMASEDDPSIGSIRIGLESVAIALYRNSSRTPQIMGAGVSSFGGAIVGAWTEACLNAVHGDWPEIVDAVRRAETEEVA